MSPTKTPTETENMKESPSTTKQKHCPILLSFNSILHGTLDENEHPVLCLLPPQRLRHGTHGQQIGGIVHW